MLLRHLPKIWIVTRSDCAAKSAISPLGSEGARSNVLWHKLNSWSYCAGEGIYGGRNLSAEICDSLVFVEHRRRRSCDGGAMASNICDTEIQC